MRKKTLIVWMVLLISIIVVIFTSCKLSETRRMYAIADEHYEKLSDNVNTSRQKNNWENSNEIPLLTIDFNALKAINKETRAWLYCPDTVINYPIMESDNYEWYLRHLPDGTYNANGSLFIDYNSSVDFSGRLNIVYGHNMKSGKMFGSLVKYKQQKYFDEHPYMYLYTEEDNYRIDLLYGCVIDAGQWRDRAFMYESNLNAFLDYASSKTTFKSTVNYNQNDKFIVFSTCSYEFDDARYVVVGVMRKK